MAHRILALAARSIKVRSVPFGAAGAHGAAVVDPTKVIIGNREVVGYGFNGQASYVDRADFPMPAIRWREPTSDVKVLREKEKGDWNKLSLEEKKAIYRSSFRQTFAEFKAPTGQWKSIIGMSLFLASLGVWCFMFMKFFVYSPLPDSFKPEAQEAQLRRMIDLHMNPIEGLASKWDYEKDDWKK